MTKWDKEFTKKFGKLGITIRYVDDILMVMRGIQLGWKYDKQKIKMIYDAQIKD